MATDRGPAWSALLNRRPRTPDELAAWLHVVLGLTFSRAAVCRGHTAPFDVLCESFFGRPDLMLVHGARGTGKSFLSAVDSHLDSRFHPGHGTRILGGSYSQSRQIHGAIKRAVIATREDAGSIREFLTGEVRYRNGSEIALLAASSTSVRGPHVPSLKLDEVDEIKEEIREDAMGIPEAYGDLGAKVMMTSTWHKVAGPMATLMAKAEAGEFPARSNCVFEVLERCPESRSGPFVGGDDIYAGCPECPIRPYCHEDVGGFGRGVPKAKRSAGHYKINTLIQKTKGVSPRVFNSDYLCKGPSVAGLWFQEFDAEPGGRHVREADAEYVPGLPVHLAIDPGVHTGAVFFQVAGATGRWGPTKRVRAFADYYSENVSPERVARDLVAIAAARCGGAVHHAYMDPAGDARSGFGAGVTILAEYARGGLNHVRKWPKPKGSVQEGLTLVEALLGTAAGDVGLVIHPRCRDLVVALQNFRRKRRENQWLDEPEDPQHPHEDLVEALRGGLRMAFPRGREDLEKAGFRTMHPSVFLT